MAPTKSLWKTSDLVYALENAAEFLENEEWPEDDGGVQVAANKEGAKRIRAMTERLIKKDALRSRTAR